MPEGIEIRIQAEQLSKFLQDKITKNKNQIIRLNWDDKSRFHPDKSGIKGIELISLPLTLQKIWSRGKVLIFENILSNRKKEKEKEKEEKKDKLYFVSQFGMAGYWTCINLNEEELRTKGTSEIIREVKRKEKHANFWIVLGSLSEIPEEREQGLYVPDSVLFYHDSRHFGNFSVTKDLSFIWKKHGPCLMEAAVQRYVPESFYLNKSKEVASVERLRSCMKNKRIENKWVFDFLLEQKHVSGIGNYLCNEILYASKISPFRKLKDITEDEIILIFDNSLDIIYRSYLDQGPTNGYFANGKFQLKVYQKDFDPLGNVVIKDTQSAKRTIHYVPAIQI